MKVKETRGRKPNKMLGTEEVKKNEVEIESTITVEEVKTETETITTEEEVKTETETITTEEEVKTETETTTIVKEVEVKPIGVKTETEKSEIKEVERKRVFKLCLKNEYGVVVAEADSIEELVGIHHRNKLGNVKVFAK